MNGRRAGLVVAVLVAAAGCATMTEQSLIAKGLKPQTAQDLEQTYSRPVRGRWVNDRNQSGTGEYTPNGVARLSWAGGGATGKWRIVGGKFCTTYPEVRGGTENCFTTYQTGPNEFISFNSDGSYNATASRIE